MLSFIAALLFLAGPACAAELDIDPAKPSYQNARYGFAVEWPAGEYSVNESDNGDGITVRDGKGLEMLVWGGMDQDVLGLTEEQFYRRAQKKGASYKKTDKKQRWYVVSGIEDRSIYYIKSYYTDSAVVTMQITYPADRKKSCDAFVSRAAGSFKP